MRARRYLRIRIGGREPLDGGDFWGVDIYREGKRRYWLVYWEVAAERMLAEDESGWLETWFGPFVSTSEAMRWWDSVPEYAGRKLLSEAPPLPREGRPPLPALGR